MLFFHMNDIHWQPNESVISHFKYMDNIETIVDILSSIGLNSVPTLMKPFHVLSQGEQYRALLARLLQTTFINLNTDTENKTGNKNENKNENENGNESGNESGNENENYYWIIIDDFTSVLDRVLACTVAATIVRFIRRQHWYNDKYNNNYNTKKKLVLYWHLALRILYLIYNLI